MSYLELCLNCNGKAFFQLDQHGCVKELPDSIFIKYVGKPPTIVRCVMCEGSGYWMIGDPRLPLPADSESSESAEKSERVRD